MYSQGKSDWRFVFCGPKLQDENSRTSKGAGWTLPRKHMFLFLEVRRPP